jgi:15-cis-phytoene synthase
LAAPADTPPLPHQAAFDHCAALLRAADRDRFLTALFAPPACRPSLHALYAFNVEITRVREAIREPLAGEIRLQWWSEAIAGDRAGEARANPVAAALLATIARHGLPTDLATGLIAAHRFDLYNEPMGTLAEFDDYARATSATLIALSARILGDASSLGELAHHAGLAQAVAGLLEALPVHAARGQLYVPMEVLDRHGVTREDIAAGLATPQLHAALGEMRRKAGGHLAQAARLAANLPTELLPAVLPIALVRPILDRMERHDPFASGALAQWRRQWHLWRAARRPARIFV